MKLEALRTDYSSVSGEPFRHFFCPLLLEDEPAELCKAHLVNQAFGNPSRKWTVQRADVDNFYGAFFESSFIDLERPQLIDGYLRGTSINAGIRPQLFHKGEEVGYYIPGNVVPPNHSEVLLQAGLQPIRLAIKLSPNEVIKTESQDWQFVCEKDCRLQALVSVLKAAHLTLFEMLGYRYALSAGGIFLGNSILGEFFKTNRSLTKSEVIGNASKHFPQYANLVRPVLRAEETVDDTIGGRLVYICEEPSRWAVVVLIRTSELMHAAIVPMLESTEAAVRFARFLHERGSTIRARKAIFDGDAFQASPVIEELTWPEANFER